MNLTKVKRRYQDGCDMRPILLKACIADDHEVVDFLLSTGMSLSDELSSCILRDLDSMAIKLIEAGADVNSKVGFGRIYSPLITAVISQRLDVIPYLCKYGADVNACDEDGCNALHYAYHIGNLELVKLLLQLGVPIIRDNEGCLPIDYTDNEEIETYTIQLTM